MRYFLSLVLLPLILSCSPQEEVDHQIFVNVDLSAVPVVLTALNQIIDSDIDVNGLVALTNSVSLDDEKQQRFAVTYQSEQTEMLYHVWREQADWVHLYFSSPSEELIAAVKATTAAFARPSGDG